MKTRTTFKKLLLLSAMVCGMSTALSAGVTELRWRVPGTSPSPWPSNDYSYCGAAPARDLQISFACGVCPTSICANNRYKYETRLYKNGSQVAIQTQYSNVNSNIAYWNGYTTDAGTYQAFVTSYVQNPACNGLYTLLESNVPSNTFVVTATNGTPIMNINGTSPGGVINVCASNITMNAAATTCELNYNINVQESDIWWNRTYDYEWGLWFAGAAPNGINLQMLATTYSYPAYGYTGSAARQGSPLIGGTLPSGADRYYRVSLCVGPTWTCTTALIKVNGGCKTSPTAEDNNVYQVVDGPGGQQHLQPTTLSALLQTKADMTVFPNPSTGLFAVHMPSSGKATLEVYDMKGSKVASAEFEGESYQLDLSREPKGIYLVTVSDGNEHYTKRIVLE